MKNLILMSALLTFLTSCGELSYKTGAGVADLDRDKNSCKTNQSNVELATCLEAKGWALKNLNEISLFDHLAVKEDTRYSNTMSATTTIEQLSVEKLAPERPNTQSLDTKSLNTLATETHEIEKSAEISNTQPAEIVTTDTNKVAAEKAVMANATDQFNVRSWWKLGAKNNAFAEDSEACSAKLGEAHAPNHVLQQYTAAFLVCMRDKHWKAAAKAI